MNIAGLRFLLILSIAVLAGVGGWAVQDGYAISASVCFAMALVNLIIYADTIRR